MFACTIRILAIGYCVTVSVVSFPAPECQDLSRLRKTTTKLKEIIGSGLRPGKRPPDARWHPRSQWCALHPAQQRARCVAEKRVVAGLRDLPGLLWRCACSPLTEASTPVASTTPHLGKVTWFQARPSRRTGTVSVILLPHVSRQARCLGHVREYQTHGTQ